MQTLGFNYRLTDIQSALGLSQLRKLEGFVTRRREIAKLYDVGFSQVDWVEPLIVNNDESAYHLYVVKIDFEKIFL